MMRLGALLVATVAMLCSTGCETRARRPDDRPAFARFYIEAQGDSGVPVTLPRSGVRLLLNAQPVITEGDIVNVELVQVDLGKCLLFQLTPAAARDLYRMSGSHQGRRLVLFVDGAPLGARRIDGPLAEGAIFVFVEIDEAVLPKLVHDLKKSCAALQRELARKA